MPKMIKVQSNVNHRAEVLVQSLQRLWAVSASTRAFTVPVLSPQRLSSAVSPSARSFTYAEVSPSAWALAHQRLPCRGSRADAPIGYFIEHLDFSASIHYEISLCEGLFCLQALRSQDNTPTVLLLRFMFNADEPKIKVSQT